MIRFYNLVRIQLFKLFESKSEIVLRPWLKYKLMFFDEVKLYMSKTYVLGESV